MDKYSDLNSLVTELMNNINNNLILVIFAKRVYMNNAKLVVSTTKPIPSENKTVFIKKIPIIEGNIQYRFFSR